MLKIFYILKIIIIFISNIGGWREDPGQHTGIKQRPVLTGLLISHTPESSAEQDGTPWSPRIM